MTIHFFTKGDASVPSSRTRIYFLAEELERRGIATTVRSLGASPDGGVAARPSWQTFQSFLSALRSIPRSDTVVLQRTIYDRSFLAAAVLARILFGRRFIFDIDDAVYLHSPWKTEILTRLADAVICAGEYVATWARKRNRLVWIIPTGIRYGQIRELIRTADYASARSQPIGNGVMGAAFLRDGVPSASTEPIIGWAGNGPAHRANLAFIAPVLKRLMDEGILFRFTLIGAFGDATIPALFAFLGERLRVIDRLPPEAVFGEMRQFDIGIMPLEPDPWANAKYLKTIEYMACGVPPVSSRLGENAHIIRHGENGMLALTPDEWVDALRFLLTHPEERKRMGAVAVNDAAAFDMTKNTDRFQTLLERLTPRV